MGGSKLRPTGLYSPIKNGVLLPGELRYEQEPVGTTITVDCKAVAFSGRPDCTDRNAARVHLTLYPAEALKMLADLFQAMDYVGREQAINRITAIEKREDW